MNVQVVVETKNGDTYDGMLQGVDNFMNVKLSEVIITDQSGTIFSKCPNECFIRGNTVKSIRFD